MVALTLAALALRLTGIDFGLPVALEQDCKIPLQVELLESGEEHPEEDPEFRWYPLLVARLAALGPTKAEAAPGAPLERQLAAAARPHVIVRMTVALLAVLAVPGTFLLARAFLSPGWSLVAAAFVAFSLLGQSFAQQSRPHAPAAALFLLAVLAALRMRRRPSWGSYLLAGVAAALALGTLQSAVLLAPALAAAHLLREGPRRILDPKLALVLLPIALAVPAFYPFLQMGSGGDVLELGGHLIFLEQFNGRGFIALARALSSYEPVLLALAAAGALALALPRKRDGSRASAARRADLAVALAFALPYVAVFGLYERTYERFALPLVPYFACLAAYALARLAERIPVSSARRPLAATLLASLALALPAYACARLAWIRARPHTSEHAARWVAEHVNPEYDVLLFPPTLDLPIFRAPEGLAHGGRTAAELRHLPWARYQALHPERPEGARAWRLRWMPLEAGLAAIAADPARWLAGLGGDWAVIEVFAGNRVHPSGTRIREALRRRATRVARFSPDGQDDYSEHPLGYQDETSVPAPHFLRRVLQARGTGPVIEIYRLSGAHGG
ncbi:MAG TPA: glycosyltransferase family 39 protein [Planctomycetota bacterium]|nr:glycosyltransferase family 39 protein [Planctomycetota bacterium]